MRNQIPSRASVCAAVVAVFIVVAGAVAAMGLVLAPDALAKPAGSLSSSEYQQLSALSTRLKPKGVLGLKMLGACNKTLAVSPLVTSVRASCSSVAELHIDLLNLDPAASRCSKQHAASVYACVLPAYSKLSHATLGLYRAEATVRRIGTARGLGNPCVTGLSDPADVVALEKRMVASTAAMAADVRQQNAKALVTDSNLFEKELKTATTESDQSPGSAVNLSSCKHS
jgi:hypothetical protein